MNTVFETENYKVVKAVYTPPFSRSSNHGCKLGSRKTVWQIFDKNNNRVERDSKGFIISGYNFATRKAAIEEVKRMEG